MNTQETRKILAVLKSYYPRFCNGISQEDAEMLVEGWAVQFADVPYSVVSLAVSKVVDTHRYLPDNPIAEIKKKITDVHWEAYEGMRGKCSKAEYAVYKEIYEKTMQYKHNLPRVTLENVIRTGRLLEG